MSTIEGAFAVPLYYNSLVHRLKMAIDYRNLDLRDGARMVNNQCIDNICKKILNVNAVNHQ